ncbi:heparinase [Candidatus Poribacteria bacterium]|nr:heparinase [Candidatus Poribacteria bacterium]
MIKQIYDREKLKDILITKDSWHPYPTAREHSEWETIPESIRKAHIKRGEEKLGYDWPTVLAVRYMDYVRTGDRRKHQSVSFGRRNALTDLVIAECMENQGRFMDDIMNGIWAICEESFWGVAAHLGAQKVGSGLPDVAEPIVDLFAAETSALLAWTMYLVGSKLDGISKLIVPRIKLEIDRRIHTPLLERDNFGWMGFQGQRVNNWNPWICSNWLTSALIVEDDEERRVNLVAKAIRTLDNFIDPYPKDGGCDEGPGYWGRAGASLYDCLELLYSATDGVIDVYDEPLIQNIAKFIYRVQIHDRYFINFADAPAMLTPSPFIVYHFGKRINDPAMISLGKWSASKQDIKKNGYATNIGRMLPALFSIEEILDADSNPPLPRDVWLNVIQVMVARDKEGSSEGFFLAVKGGHNAESHNHNDVGNFVIYMDGKPVLVDAGVEAYTAKTFSSRRYEIWTMRSTYHNLPDINSTQQSAGGNYKSEKVSYSYDDHKAEINQDIATAYPESANVKSWKRSVILNRGENITIVDSYDLKESNGETILNLLTPCKVVVKEKGVIHLENSHLSDDRSSGSARIHYDKDKLDVDIEEVKVEDKRLNSIWGDFLYRIMLKVKDKSLNNTVKLLIN